MKQSNERKWKIREREILYQNILKDGFCKSFLVPFMPFSVCVCVRFFGFERCPTNKMVMKSCKSVKLLSVFAFNYIKNTNSMSLYTWVCVCEWVFNNTILYMKKQQRLGKMCAVFETQSCTCNTQQNKRPTLLNISMNRTNNVLSTQTLANAHFHS